MINTSTTRPSVPRALAIGALADAVCVLVFVAIGRSSHAEGITAGGIVGTGWPFWLGVAGGYVGVAAFRLAPASPAGAAMVLVKTVAIGMVLRSVVAHEGIPPAFVVAALIFLGLFLGGWRVIMRLALTRRAATRRGRTGGGARHRIGDRRESTASTSAPAGGPGPHRPRTPSSFPATGGNTSFHDTDPGDLSAQRPAHEATGRDRMAHGHHTAAHDHTARHRGGRDRTAREYVPAGPPEAGRPERSSLP